MKVVNVEVGSDLYLAGRTEDGLDYTAEVYIVVVEFADGTRWAHKTSFRGCEVEVDNEDGYKFFKDVRDAAQAKANALCNRVTFAVDAGRTLDRACWVDYFPVYGSGAYDAGVGCMTREELAA
jgi:hypothetical protein